MYLFFVYPSSKFLDMSIELEITPETRGHTGLEREETPERRVVAMKEEMGETE